jgi:hypothetical protein
MLGLDERGLYITACSLIYVAGGPITKQDLRKACPGTTQAFNRILLRMIELGKLTLTDGMIDQARCERELKNAKKRLENSPKTSPFFEADLGENNDLDKPHAGAKVYQATNKDFEKELGKLGRSAPSEYRPPTEQEKAEVAELVQQARDALTGRAPKRDAEVHDEAAYRAEIKQRRRDAWLFEMAGWVSQRFDGSARLEAWDALEQARIAGTRQKTPADVRKMVDRLDKLYRTERDAQQVEPMKEAAD